MIYLPAASSIEEVRIQTMQKSASRFQLHNLLFRASIIVFCIGMISLMGAAVLTFVSVQNFVGPILRMLEAGVLLIWGGISIGTFLTVWIGLPQAGEPATYRILFLLNQIIGVILFGGLLIGALGYW